MEEDEQEEEEDEEDGGAAVEEEEEEEDAGGDEDLRVKKRLRLPVSEGVKKLVDNLGARVSTPRVYRTVKLQQADHGPASMRLRRWSAGPTTSYASPSSQSSVESPSAARRSQRRVSSTTFVRGCCIFTC